MDTPVPDSGSSPQLSILVIGYQMAEQLANTIKSLSHDYQIGVHATDYEVVVIENRSEDMLSQKLVESLPTNIRYYQRDNDSSSPVAALAEGLELCRGHQLGVIIDGAQLVTPGVIRFAKMAFKYADDPLIAVPGYHLGHKMQHEVEDAGELLTAQREFLESINWTESDNGYRLFNWACFSPANRNGFLHPLMESNVFFCLKQSFIDIDGANARFQLPGGGAINLHILRKLGMSATRPLILLAGEGTFHQYHGGVTTANPAEYEARVNTFNEQLQEIWDMNFKALRREPVILGQFPEPVHAHLQASCTTAQRRFQRLREGNTPLWEDDFNLSLAAKGVVK